MRWLRNIYRRTFQVGLLSSCTTSGSDNGAVRLWARGPEEGVSVEQQAIGHRKV
jgi:hypothetical protein